MRKLLKAAIVIVACMALTACATTAEPTGRQDNPEVTSVQETVTENKLDDKVKDTIVVYFSATGTTKELAGELTTAIGADIFEIVPQQPYTDADLDYSDDNSRSTLEMNDLSSRPEISGQIDNFEQYQNVIMGYPIWWSDAPRIMSTFVESYDFKDKTILPFCTSGGSGIGSSAKNLEQLAGSGIWLEGQRFSNVDDLVSWVEQNIKD